MLEVLRSEVEQFIDSFSDIVSPLHLNLSSSVQRDLEVLFESVSPLHSVNRQASSGFGSMSAGSSPSAISGSQWGMARPSFDLDGVEVRRGSKMAGGDVSLASRIAQITRMLTKDEPYEAGPSPPPLSTTPSFEVDLLDNYVDIKEDIKNIEGVNLPSSFEDACSDLTESELASLLDDEVRSQPSWS